MVETDREGLQLAYEAGREDCLRSLPQTREAWACAIDALIVDDPREFNAWMTQGLVLLKQQAQAEKQARRPQSVMAQDGIEEMQTSGIPTDAPSDGAARWAAKVAARHGLQDAPQYEAPMPAPMQAQDPNLAMLVRAAVQEYIQASGTHLAPLPPPQQLAGYPTFQPPSVFPPAAPLPRPNFWYDPRRR